MTDLERRDVVAGLTALAVMGAFTHPDEAEAGEGGGILLTLIIIVAIVAIIAASNASAWTGNPEKGRLVTDSRAKGGVPGAQRLKRATRCGDVRQNGDKLYLNLSDGCAQQLANARSVHVSVPIPGKGASVEFTMKRANKRVTPQQVAAVKAGGGQKVGTVRMDAIGLVLDTPKARIG